MHARTMRLTPESLANRVLGTGRLEHMENGALAVLDGPISSWPEATATPDGTHHRWSTGQGLARRAWDLHLPLITTTANGSPPVVTLNDFTPQVTVTYATPMPIVDYDGTFKSTTTDIALLEPRRQVTPGAIRIHRSIANGRGTRAEISFFWPDEPPFAAGYTAPLVRFEETTLTGLTSQPIVLRGYYSQTYRPGHHNFTEEFIFEPRLEPGVSPDSLAELAAADIQYLHIHAGFTTPDFHIIGFDGKVRRL